MNLFPLFLKLKGRPCLVVGAGAVGASKIASLLLAGARVRVVAPEAAPQVRAWARARRITWEKRGFESRDLEGMLLVVAATPSPKLHRRIYRQAKRLGVLCNVVDVPPLCDFYYPAVVRRGPLQIAVSTGGYSPALAQRLRKQLERQFGSEYGVWIQHLGRKRGKVQSQTADPRKRRRILHRHASAKAFKLFHRRNRGKSTRRSRARR